MRNHNEMSTDSLKIFNSKIGLGNKGRFSNSIASGAVI